MNTERHSLWLPAGKGGRALVRPPRAYQPALVAIETFSPSPGMPAVVAVDDETFFEDVAVAAIEGGGEVVFTAQRHANTACSLPSRSRERRTSPPASRSGTVAPSLREYQPAPAMPRLAPRATPVRRGRRRNPLSPALRLPLRLRALPARVGLPFMVVVRSAAADVD